MQLAVTQKHTMFRKKCCNIRIMRTKIDLKLPIKIILSWYATNGNKVANYLSLPRKIIKSNWNSSFNIGFSIFANSTLYWHNKRRANFVEYLPNAFNTEAIEIERKIYWKSIPNRKKPRKQKQKILKEQRQLNYLEQDLV